MTTLFENVRYCYENLGFSFTPLDGKKPVLTGWQEAPRESLEEALTWAAQGNVGLRTGKASWILVVDVDEGGDRAALKLVVTVTVRTGTGLHLYFRCSEPLGNSRGKLGEHIDTRGEGGQVVFPGSVHPVTGTPYEWVPGLEPWNVAIAEIPPHIVAMLKADKKTERKTPKPDAKASPDFKARRWAAQAMRKEAENVAKAVEGGRNDTLNVAAFNLGQIVGGGYLARAEVVTALMDAAKTAGLPHNEAWATIGSGLDAGIEKPRVYEPRVEDAAVLAKAVAVAESAGYLLKPGPHVTGDGEYVEQSGDMFADQVMGRLPEDSIYRKDSLPGSVFGVPGRRRWDRMDEADAMLLVDRHVKCGRWVKGRGEDAEPVIRYEVCTSTDAKLVLSKARGHGRVRELRALVNYPVYGPDWNLLTPGWRDGLYYDEPPELQGLEPDRDYEFIHNVLLDLVCDFPFRSDADRQNFFGLLLTPLIAPALQANRPLHLVHASLERTGKSKLAGDVLGGVIQGRPVPAMQITEREEEREKRITSLLLKGDTLVHLDNLPGFIDSPALSSLLTSQEFCTRILRESRQVALPNLMTVVASGNNVQFTGEVAKRIVPIMLQAASAAPESRQDFHHPDLNAFIREERRTVLACLLGMVENWKSAGKPLCKNRLGGFEEWSGVIGGILAKNSFKAWRTNEREWRSAADPGGSELSDFVAAWSELWGTYEVKPDVLLTIAKERGLFVHLTMKPGAPVSFGRMLQRHRDTPVNEFVVRYDRRGGYPVYWLEPLK